MHSTINRTQTVFGFFTTVALTVAAAIALSVLLYPADDVTSSVELKNVQVYVCLSPCVFLVVATGEKERKKERNKKLMIIYRECRIKGRPHYYSSKKEEYARISFDLDAGMETTSFLFFSSRLLARVLLSICLSIYLFPRSTRLTISILSIAIDLSPLFNWNTKQLFVYVYASYPSSSDALATSESIIWDKIIPAPESPYSPSVLKERFFPAKSTSKSKSRRQSSSTKQTQKKGEGKPGVLKLRNQKPKYQITDITGKMAERQNVTLTVGWNVQPWVGALWWSAGTGAVPHTSGQTGQSKTFDLPPLKGTRQEGANGDAAKTKANA